MYKRILVTFGIVLLTLLILLWGYLLLFGAPDSADQFFTELRLGSGPTEREDATFLIQESDRQQLALPNQLSQLTTRSVAGFIPVTSSTTTKVIYGEIGTGYIYEVDLNTGIETRLSGITFGKTVDAVLNPEASAVILTTENDLATESTLYFLGEDNNSTIDLGEADNIRFTSNDTVQYTVDVNSQLINYEYDLVLETERELWRSPITDVMVYDIGNSPYIFTKPAPELEGNVYAVRQSLTSIHSPLYVYYAKPIDQNRLIETYYNFDFGALTSRIYEINTGSSVDFPILTLPEKCALNPKNISMMWCASPVPFPENLERESIRDWHFGLNTFEDWLWTIDLEQNIATAEVDFLETVGFTIDVEDLTFDQAGENIFFINKINGALWRYQVASEPELVVEEESEAEVELSGEVEGE